MNAELDPLDDDVLSVLKQVDKKGDLPDGAGARILRAVEARVAMTPAAHPAPPPAAAPKGLGPFISAHPWSALAVAFVLGGGVGWGLPRAPEIRVVTTRTPVSAHAQPPVALSAPSWARVETPAPAPPPSVPSSRPHEPSAQASNGQQLAAESAILDIARMAIARGEAEHALAAVERHRTTFPHGLLGEERDALYIKALILAGRGDEARAQTARFRAAYPESLFLPALESALRSIP